MNLDILVHDVRDGARPVGVGLNAKAATAVDSLGAVLFVCHRAAREGNVSNCKHVC